MDLETENRIAAILMKEAAELRRQSEKDGVGAYLRHPQVRGRPNARFLTATVLGVQQANKVVEVNEMWKVRQKELELDDRLRGRSREGNNACKSRMNFNPSKNLMKDQTRSREIPSSSWSSSERVSETCHPTEDEGLKDEELEEFLHSRVKRGRGAVGSRMDETGPYLVPCSESDSNRLASSNVTDRHVYGPDKPKLLKYLSSSEDEELDVNRRKRSKNGSRKLHSKEHKSKHKSKHKSEKRSKASKERKRHR